MQKLEIDVKGMTCGHCANAVTEELAEVPGVGDIQVNLNPGAESVSTVTVGLKDEVSHDAIRDAIDEAGYEVTDLRYL